MATFKKSYDDLITSTWKKWLHWIFVFLAWMSNQVGLKENVENMEGILCQTFHIVVRDYDMAYMRRIVGEGLTYQDHQI